MIPVLNQKRLIGIVLIGDTVKIIQMSLPILIGQATKAAKVIHVQECKEMVCVIINIF